ncbi:MAG: diguanylate cyclase [Thiobacillus sp. SCN 63-374]|nr:MAG: diguanylate cyclase [Thiobacillus sp. SCN 63-374]
MARSAAPLTESRIRQIKTPDKPTKLADGGGMYLLLRPDGSRYWRLDYRFDGKRKTLALGVYPKISLGEARRRRRAAKALLAAGQDPGAVRKADKANKPGAGADGQAYALAILGEGMWDWDLRSGQVRHNAQWAQLMGLDDRQQEHDWQQAVAALHEQDRETVMTAIRHCLEGTAAFECEHRIRHADGATIWVRNRGEVMRYDADGTPLRMVGSLCEVTEQRHEARVMRCHNLLLQTIAAVNEMLMQELPEQELMARICQELVRDNLFRMAWIGLVDEDGVTVRPVAEAGSVRGYLAQADIRCDDSPQGQGPTGKAIRSGITVINDDTETNRQFVPWRKRARAQGYRSSASAPLRVNGRVIGALNVYSDEAHAFGPEKRILLEKLAADLGVAMGNRAALAALRESEERFRLISSVATDLLYSSLQTGTGFYAFDWATASADRIFGYTLDEILEQGCWRSYVHPEDLPEFDRNITHLAPGQRSECELRIIARDGATRTIRAYSMEVKSDDGQHRLYGACQDITERRQAEARIAFLAHHDALTGLPNRVLLRDRFEQALAVVQRARSHMAVLFLDLDNFKVVNDSLGHAAGDELLLAAVSRLSHCMRDSDTISRQGGDEFVLLLNDIPDLDTVKRIATDILSHLAEPLEINGHVLNTSCSIGVAIYPGDGSDFDSLLQKADTAMYNAKGAGRNSYRFFDEQMNQQAQEHLMLQHRLHQALYRAELQVHYQPQLEIGSGKVIGVEALLRWQNAELGEVAPDRFIPVAESCGLIVPIGAWVLEQACRQAQAWRQAGLSDLAVSVNLSAMQFHRFSLVEMVAGVLGRSGLPPHLLELELTESILLQDVEGTLDTVRQLKRLGVRLSIDDFGTGYSSLSYLKRFAVDRLKIDQSFIRDVNTDPDNAAIVRAIIQLARSLRLDIIAEGVETPAQLAFLREEGCREAQGYLFSRPLQPAAMEAFLRERIVPAGAANGAAL